MTDTPEKLKFHPNPVVNMVLTEVAEGRGLDEAHRKLGMGSLTAGNAEIMVRIALASVAPGSTQLSDYATRPEGVAKPTDPAR